MIRNHATATTEDMLDSLPYFTFEDDDVYPDEEFVRKADVARLLATARTATIEDAARVINEVLGGDMDNHARIAAHRLADAGLLATARTRPTREQIDRAVGEVLSNAANHPDPVAVLGRSIAPLLTKVTDAVLALYADQPTRDDLARAIASGYETDHPTPNRHDYRAADAVLALLRGGA